MLASTTHLLHTAYPGVSTRSTDAGDTASLPPPSKYHHPDAVGADMHTTHHVLRSEKLAFLPRPHPCIWLHSCLPMHQHRDSWLTCACYPQSFACPCAHCARAQKLRPRCQQKRRFHPPCNFVALTLPRLLMGISSSRRNPIFKRRGGGLATLQQWRKMNLCGK